MNTLQNINRPILKTITICHICKCLTNFLEIHLFLLKLRKKSWLANFWDCVQSWKRTEGVSYVEIFSMTFVEVFRSDSTDTSITLQHHLAWSLITISGLFTDNSLSVCICISKLKKGYKLLHFQWPSQWQLLRYFYFLMLTLLLMDICSCKWAHQDINMICLFSHACYISYIEDWWLLPLEASNNKFLKEGLNGVVAFTVID